MPKVYTVGSDFSVRRMYEAFKFEMVDDGEEADLIQFTGGADISSELYNEPRHPKTFPNPARDKREELEFRKWIDKKPMVGICRGAQLFHAMMGGKIYQHVNNHTKSHEMTTIDGEVITVTSLHHQMMVYCGIHDSMLLARSSTDCIAQVLDPISETFISKKLKVEPEVIFYPHQRLLCFQAHPEYTPCATRDYYFKLLNDYLGLK